jgi:hypothetical protein
MRITVVPRYLGYHRDSERDVFLLTLEELDEPYALPGVEGRHFICFCAMDATGLRADELGKACSRLLRLGCAYFCTWGPDCERVHDIMDEEDMKLNPSPSDLGCVMTTWHAKESLKEALDSFLDCIQPDETYAPNGCNAALIISFAGNDWNREIEQYITAKMVPAR